MAKLYFRHGAMGSSKTASALMARYNYIERGKNPLLVKPMIDTRDGARTVRSRIGIEAEAVFFEELKAYDHEKIKSYDAVIVDEVQFLSVSDIEFLASVVDEDQVPVLCYGLKTDFRGLLFEGSKRLMELADEIEEIPTVCWCGKKARFNARVINGEVVSEGEQIVLGANESYVALCRRHFFEKKIHR